MAKKNDGVVKVPGKRGRKSLSEADKENMALRRTEAATEKKNALEFLNSNPQFTNPKFWALVDAEKAQAVVDAIAKGGEKAKQAKIEELLAQVKALSGEQA